MSLVILPRFWSEYPVLWFTHAEAVFSMQGVTSDGDMYNYLLTHLDKETLVLVGDVICDNAKTEAHKDEKYKYMKSEIMKRISLNNMRKIKFGTQKPSEYYVQLKLKADWVPPINIQDMWLRNLPSHITEILMLTASQDMGMLCRLADKLIQVLPQPGIKSSVTSVNSNENTKVFENIKAELDNIKKQFETLEKCCDESKKSLTESSKIVNEALNIPDETKKTICWKHSLYGDNAYTCIPPCDYKSKS